MQVSSILDYSGSDVCNGKFQYAELELTNKQLTNVVVAEIYNLSMFYVNLSSNINKLNGLMDSLQLVYDFV